MRNRKKKKKRRKGGKRGWGEEEPRDQKPVASCVTKWHNGKKEERGRGDGSEAAMNKRRVGSMKRGPNGGGVKPERLGKEGGGPRISWGDDGQVLV